MKKVLVIAPYAYLPWYSGGQKFIGQFLQHLGQRTVLTVISVAKNDESLATHYELLPLLKESFSRYYDLSLTRKISSLVKLNRIDTIIWEHPYYAWLAFSVRKKTGIKTLIHTHNIEHLRFKSTGRWWWRILRWYERWCFKKADGLFFITPEDKQFAIEKWNIAAAKCFDLPFGVEITGSPSDRPQSREEIRQRHAIPAEKKILLFTGALEYKPNLDALQTILRDINPLLMSQPGFNYTLLVCGKGLPPEMNGLKAYADKNILYAGFAAGIDQYYKAADVFLNPVLSGGGIKTKMVESIAYGTPVVSTVTGATGMDKSVCGDKLVLTDDGAWEKFAALVMEKAMEPSGTTPQSFYIKYNWDNIISSVTATAI
ncbi:MAG: glycosyltransferase family 4 protein [Chitinophagaceae bacterium]